MTKFNKVNLFFLALFILGAWIRSLDVWRPVDGRVRPEWRECDYAAISRNYYREDMNIFYPRIDWRGDGPGYGEMEFPIFPWSVAVLYKIFGYNELFGRFLSYFISLFTLIIFFRIAHYLLQHLSALMSSLFFVLSPLIVRISNSLQPEGLMLFCYLLATYAFIRWLDEDRWMWYGISICATALAILTKVTCAHIGFLFLGLIIIQKGFKSLQRVRIWAFPVLSLSPALVWYLHAHKLWLVYGNSLGLSNEYHWVGWDIFTNPAFILGLAKVEIFNVWMPLGGIIALAAIWFQRSDKAVKISFLWLIAILIYYLVTIRTTGDNWASYYHVISVPPAALLLGTGVDLISKFIKNLRYFIIATIVSVLISTAIILGELLLRISYPRFLITGFVLMLLSAKIALFPFTSNYRSKGILFPAKVASKFYNLGIYFLLISIFSTFIFQGFQIRGDLHPMGLQSKYQCAQLLKPYIPEDALIIASGGPSKDETGYPVAYNASYMFFWLDRKGFNISVEEQSVDTVKSLVNRGARYFVLEKRALSANPEFKEDLQKEFALLKECDEAYLFRLTGE